MTRLVCALIVVVAWPLEVIAQERIGGTITAASNFTYRGIGRYHHNRALYGNVEYRSAQGVYAGIWLGQYRPPWSNERDLERDLYMGFLAPVRTLDQLDISLWKGTYRRETPRDYDWQELAASYSFEGRWNLLAAVTDNLYGSDARSLFGEVSFTRRFEHLALTLAVGAHGFDADYLADVGYVSTRLALNWRDWHLFLDGVWTELLSKETFVSESWLTSSMTAGVSFTF